MFIKDSKKLWLVCSSVASVALFYGLLNGILLSLAHWTEKHYATYPWRQEDYLRYLLPSLFVERGPDRILLAGPSEAREGLLYERFNRRFPGMQTFQGAQSLGTFNDLLLVLEYIEKVYGAEAKPRVLVLGITTRFVANIPSLSSPLVTAINRYSPFYRVELTPAGSRLVPKSLWQGLESRVRFLWKQQPRYLAALFTLVDRLVDELLSYKALPQGLVRVRRYTSPYKYHHLQPMDAPTIQGWLHDPDSFWFKTHAWNPEADASLIQSQLSRLVEVSTRWGMQLYVVNLPEHPLNREGYRRGSYQQYLTLVQAALGGTPFLNLREMLSLEEFYDAGHATLPGAIRITDRVMEFMEEHYTRAKR